MVNIKNEKDFLRFSEEFIKKINLFNLPIFTSGIFTWSIIVNKEKKITLEKDSIVITIDTIINSTVYSSFSSSKRKDYKDIANVIIILNCNNSGIKLSYNIKSVKNDKRLIYDADSLSSYLSENLFDKIISNDIIDKNHPINLSLNIFNEYDKWQELSIKDKCGFDIYSKDILDYDDQLKYKEAFKLKYGYLLDQNNEDFSFDDVDIYDIKTSKTIPHIKLNSSSCAEITKKLIEYFHLEDV